MAGEGCALDATAAGVLSDAVDLEVEETPEPPPALALGDAAADAVGLPPAAAPAGADLPEDTGEVGCADGETGEEVAPVRSEMWSHKRSNSARRCSSSGFIWPSFVLPSVMV